LASQASRRCTDDELTRWVDTSEGEMEPEVQRTYERLERLERTQERHGALLDEHSRRLDSLEDLPASLSQIHQAIGRLEAKIESQKQFSGLIQAVVWLILGGILAAGFELFKR
jgi:hypothetical protein